jgi:hypothetical protein
VTRFARGGLGAIGSAPLASPLARGVREIVIDAASSLR